MTRNDPLPARHRRGTMADQLRRAVWLNELDGERVAGEMARKSDPQSTTKDRA